MDRLRYPARRALMVDPIAPVVGLTKLMIELAAAAAHVIYHVFEGSVGAWRYVLSRRYRAAADGRFARRGAVARAALVAAGAVAMAGSLAVPISAVWVGEARNAPAPVPSQPSAKFARLPLHML